MTTVNDATIMKASASWPGSGPSASRGRGRLRRVSAGTLTRDTRAPTPGRAAARRFALDHDAVVLALLIVLAAFLRFWRLRHQGFWFDEGNTSQEVHYTPGQMLSLLKHYE